MSTITTNETKNSASLVTTETKFSPTWDESTETWAAAEGTWDNPGEQTTNESKNAATALTNQVKNT